MYVCVSFIGQLLKCWHRNAGSSTFCLNRFLKGHLLALLAPHLRHLCLVGLCHTKYLHQQQSSEIYC